MTKKPQLKLVTESKDFFRELVISALKNQKVSVIPETEFYLVSLMDRFVTTENLYSKDEAGRLKEEALAIMLKEALEVPQVELQKNIFQQIGDVSLYTAGYFYESIMRKLVDIDYYIEMGGAAYQQVATRAEADSLRKMFIELSEKFNKIVDVLSEVSEKTLPKTEKDLLRLYDLWVQTKSERIARQLRVAGIIPNESDDDPNRNKPQ